MKEMKGDFMITKYDYHKKNIGEGHYSSRPKKRKGRLVRSVFLLFFFALIIALFIYVFPEVEITIVPETQLIKNDFQVTVDPSLENDRAEENRIKGRMVEATDSLEKKFATSGEKNVGEKAQGTAVFFNQTGLTQPLTAENQLVNDDGVVFFVKQPVEIPKAEVSAEGSVVFGTVSVEVVAAEAGEEGNINPGRLTIIDLPFSKQNKIYAEVQSKLTGGTTKKIKVVSEEDLVKAEKSLSEELQPKLKTALTQKLQNGESLREELIQFEIVGVDKTVELLEEVEEFNLQLTMTVRVLVWDETILKKMVMDKIQFDKSTGEQLIESSQDVFDVKVEKNKNEETQTVLLVIHTENQITKPIDSADLIGKIKGKSEVEARRILLNEANIKDARFKFHYSITSKVPDNENRIVIKLNL